MRMFLDDLRTTPAGFHSEMTSDHAIDTLTVWKKSGVPFEEISLDHDLGGDDTARPVMLWMIENAFFPQHVHVHTANPVGRDWLYGMAQRYAPAGTTVSR
jgi:hypothetical protein